ncbi:hypothetical protein [Streptodolium elevatio]|uniref:Secreted protein n=1 Tax=Streptodolium elevatio TaxID=3157996 RepID=A0ABV3DHS5_9ACTN
MFTRSLARRPVVLALALGLTASAATIVTAQAESAPTRLPVWQVTEIKPGDALVNSLVANDGRGGALAAGSTWIRDNGEVVGYAPTIFTRDAGNRTWRQEPLKAAGTWLSLRDVAPVGSGGGVAVGTFDPALGGFVTAHGTNGVWRTGVAPAPPGVDYGRLEDVDTLSANDMWAVGTVDMFEPPPGTEPQQPIVTHWDGRTWTTAALPPPAALGWTGFDAVKAVAPDDVWVAGHASDGQAPPLAHFNGTAWKYVALPFEGNSFWAGVTALLSRGPGDVWALGFMQDAENGEESALAWHFDGRSWTRAPVPAGVRITDATLTRTGLAALTMSRDGYAVHRFDGGHWRRLDLPDSGTELQQPGAIGYANGRLTVAANGWVEGPGAPEHLRTLMFTAAA